MAGHDEEGILSISDGYGQGSAGISGHGVPQWYGSAETAMGDVAGTAWAGMTDVSFYSGVAGLAVGGVLGGALTLIPFHAIPIAGNIVRTVATLGGGALLVAKGSKDGFNTNMGRFCISAGTLLGFIGVTQILGYITAYTGLSIPGFDNLGTVLTGAAEDTDIANLAEQEGWDTLLPQRGSGSIIGQNTATAEYSDIYSAEVETTVGKDFGFEDMTHDMQERGMSDLPEYSVTVPAPLGHGVDFNLGAEDIPTGHGVDQDFGGGTSEASTSPSQVETEIGEYIQSVDVGGAYASDLTAQNPFVESVHPASPSYQPPVWYAEDVPTIVVDSPTPTPSMGSLPDELNAYMKPSTTAEEYIMDSYYVRNPGQPTQWFGSEGRQGYTGVITRAVTEAEGYGSVIGQ